MNSFMNWLKNMKKSSSKVQDKIDTTPIYVFINWSDYFNPSYIRKVISIRENRDNKYGKIGESDYLSDEWMKQVKPYKEDELFIVREGNWFGGILEAKSVSTEDLKPTCLYYLLQINKDSPSGFSIIDVTHQKTTYPWHENILVKSIMDKNLLIPYKWNELISGVPNPYEEYLFPSNAEK